MCDYLQIDHVNKQNMFTDSFGKLTELQRKNPHRYRNNRIV